MGTAWQHGTKYTEKVVTMVIFKLTGFYSNQKRCLTSLNRPKLFYTNKTGGVKSGRNTTYYHFLQCRKL